MVRFQINRLVGMIGVALVIGAGLMPTPTEAARLTKAEKAAWKQAKVACKEAAKGKKLGWLARRKLVTGCLQDTLKDYPGIDVEKRMYGVKRKPAPPLHTQDFM